MQDVIHRSVLSTMHALWSLGGVAAGLLSTIAAASGADFRAYLALVAVTCVLLVGVGGRLTGTLADFAESTDQHQESAPRGRRWRIALIASAPLVLIAISGVMVEDVANNWAAMAGVQIGGLAPETAGIAFTIMLGAQCVGRFAGDPLIERFGRSTIARWAVS